MACYGRSGPPSALIPYERIQRWHIHDTGRNHTLDKRAWLVCIGSAAEKKSPSEPATITCNCSFITTTGLAKNAWFIQGSHPLVVGKLAARFSNQASVGVRPAEDKLSRLRGASDSLADLNLPGRQGGGRRCCGPVGANDDIPLAGSWLIGRGWVALRVCTTRLVGGASCWPVTCKPSVAPFRRVLRSFPDGSGRFDSRVGCPGFQGCTGCQGLR